MFSSGSEGEGGRSPRRRGRTRVLSMVNRDILDEDDNGGAGPAKALYPVRRALGSSQVPEMSQNIGPAPISVPNNVVTSDSYQRQGGAGDWGVEVDVEPPIMTPASPDFDRITSFKNAEPPKSIPEAEARRSKARSHSKRSRGGGGGGGSGGRDEGFPRGGENHGGGTADSSNGGSSLGGGSSGKRRALRRRQSSTEDTMGPVDRAPDLPPPRRPSPPSGDSHSSRGNRSHDESDSSRTDVRKKQQDPVVVDVDLDRGDHREVDGSDTSSSQSETPSPEQFSDITSSSYASGSAPTLSESGGLPSVSDFGSRVASAYDDSVFDSASTWAGASAISVASTNAQSSVFKTPGRGSILDDPLTAVSEHNTELITTITTKRSSKDGTSGGGGGGGGWTLTENGWVKKVVPPPLPENSSSNSKTATTPFSGRSRKASPVHAPGGTAARRGSQRRSRSDRENGSSQSKPRHLPVPTSTPRRAAMSPHGAAMDAALRMLEDGSLRLGILPEEGGGGGDDKEGTERDVAYGNQIAVPPMTSLEQRRQRAKAWAKSR